MAEAQSTNEETLTENLAFAEVLAWSATRPAWQRDALRRLVQSGILGSEEIDELLEICLDPALPHTPLSDADVSSQSILGAPVSVLRIENPTGVNALAFDQKLEFAQAGLSIVYGDNGSGKSGYVRILKHACRTRDRNNKILRDVEDAAATPQTANIVFLRGATEDQFAWSPEAPSHADLPSISIFDSRSANVHVEKTNAVAYIPQPMRVLEALATACDQVKAKLDDRLAAINAKTPLAIKEPQLGADTAAGAFVRSLSTKSSIAQLDLLAQLSEAETSTSPRWKAISHKNRNEPLRKSPRRKHALMMASASSRSGRHGISCGVCDALLLEIRLGNQSREREIGIRRVVRRFAAS